MISNRVLAVCAYVATILTAAPSTAQAPLMVSIPDQAKEAAEGSLKTFSSIAGAPGNATKLGLREPSEASKVSLGIPLVDYMIDLAALKEWDGTEPMKLLRFTGQFVYPIRVGDSTRSSVTIAKVGDQWTAAVFGSPNEAQARTRVRDSLSDKAPGGETSTIQVRVPALHAIFVARQLGGELDFTPIVSNPTLGLKSGETESAQKVLLRIQPFAKELDPQVPN
jgi:hypothetical protein